MPKGSIMLKIPVDLYVVGVQENCESSVCQITQKLFGWKAN